MEPAAIRLTECFSVMRGIFRMSCSAHSFSTIPIALFIAHESVSMRMPTTVTPTPFRDADVNSRSVKSPSVVGACPFGGKVTVVFRLIAIPMLDTS